MKPTSEEKAECCVSSLVCDLKWEMNKLNKIGKCREQTNSPEEEYEERVKWEAKRSKPPDMKQMSHRANCTTWSVLRTNVSDRL